MPNRKIVILNQAVNYLTIGFANAFKEEFDSVALITGSVHAQGEALRSDIEVSWINVWRESPAWRKMLSFLVAHLRMWFLLMTRYRHYEVLFVSVPPMAYLLNLFLPHRFSMVIWDVYPDILKITGMKESHPVFRIWSALNRRSFKKAQSIFTISHSMADTLSEYVARDRVIVQPIWSIFQDERRITPAKNPFITEHDAQGKFIVQYSGNIGITHNVEILIDIAASLKDESDILFQIIGRGPRRQIIENLVRSRRLDNVQMLPFQSDENFLFSLSAADLGVVILNEVVGGGSVPSKAYNLMSLGIPALYVASKTSELARYCAEYSHAKCFSSGELDDIANFIRAVAADKKVREQLVAGSLRAAKNFRRQNADQYVRKYLALDGVEF